MLAVRFNVYLRATMDRGVTRIFYLVLWSITLTAAAVQWLPDDGFPPDINLGPDSAVAQSPSAAPTSVGAPAVPPSFAPSVPFSPYATTNPAPAASFQAPLVTSAPAAATTPAAVPPTPVFGSPTMPGPPQTTPLPINGPAALQVPAPAEEIEGARVLARVGGEVITAGEVIASVNGYLARNGHDIRSPEVLAQRDGLIRMRLQQLIDTRAVLNEAKRKIPAEGLKKAMEKFDEDFNATVVPQMLRDRKVENVAQLEALLRSEGTTLERQKRDFAETVLCKSWLAQSAKFDGEVTHEQMLQYYQGHMKDYEFPAECRWEQLMMRFDRFPSKGAAFTALAQAGNDVIQGKPFHEVARAVSQGSTATQGGGREWTRQGSLVSKAIDDAIFSLPLGMMSQILEDEQGFHIVRAIERREARRTSFLEAQVQIKKTILEERSMAARKLYVDDIRKRTTVWTAYDDPATAPTFNIAQPLPTAQRR